MRPAFLFFVVILIVSCRRNSSPPSFTTLSTNSIQGKWNIVMVTTIPYDSNGSIRPGENVVIPPPGSFYQFNSDGTWVESLSTDTLPFTTMQGTYIVNSDSSFTITNPVANSHVNCTMDTLSSVLFVFTDSRSTYFNGTEPGFLRYIFRLTK